jgi:hypothetical protein
MMNIRRSHIVQSATSLGVFQERFLETIPVSTRRGNPDPDERMSYSNRLVIFACCRCAPSYTLSYQLSGSERQTILATVVPDSWGEQGQDLQGVRPSSLRGRAFERSAEGLKFVG